MPNDTALTGNGTIMQVGGSQRVAGRDREGGGRPLGASILQAPA